MNSLQPLAAIRDAGAMPKAGQIFLGLGFRPPKRNALEIPPTYLPTDEQAKALAGLDVVLCINGYQTKYGTLRRLCSSILAARPRRFQLVDFDYKRIAFLKLGAHQ